MEFIRTLKKHREQDLTSHKACKECQTSCQSAYKTSCTVENQKCENK